ncbi:solute carrier family 12 member 6 [Scyliorhinus torazame]|uniref:solute carrier family 12 member 6 n=1 Tax=Scyliorhinus torazame TaxID=75743 RepID=UPI003B5AE4CA
MSVRFTVTPTRAEDVPGLGGGEPPQRDGEAAPAEPAEERNQNSITGEHIRLLGDGHEQGHGVFFGRGLEAGEYCDRNLALFEKRKPQLLTASPMNYISSLS